MEQGEEPWMLEEESQSQSHPGELVGIDVTVTWEKLDPRELVQMLACLRFFRKFFLELIELWK